MNDVVSFDFEGAGVRVMDRAGTPWFVASDVCRVLEIKNVSQALQPLDDDEKGICNSYTLGGMQAVSIISEAGLYILILRSHGATKRGSLAHRFRKWVTSEVLPSIRRTGFYAAPLLDAVEDDEPAAPYQMDDIRGYMILIRECRSLFGRDAAKKMWRCLPVPQPDLSGGRIAAWSAEESWWRGCIKTGQIMPGYPWPDEIAVADLMEAAWNDIAPEGRLSDRRGLAAKIGRVMRMLTPGVRMRRLSEQGRPYLYILPPLDRCRAALAS